MKRVLFVLIVVAILAGSAAFFLLRRGVIEGAQLVPAGTALYLTVPDLQRTIHRWPKTAMAQIGAEPAVSEFLRKPAQQLAAQGGFEAMDLLFKINPNRLFLAVTDLRKDGADAVFGFEYFGSRKELDGAMDRLYRELGKLVPNAAPVASDYHGDVLTTFAGPNVSLFSGSHGSWGFLSNSEAALKQALDRAAGRDRSPALAGNAGFKKVLRHLSVNPDFLWYGRPEPLFNLLLEIGKQNVSIHTKQLEKMRNVQALGGTLLFDGADQKEISFIFYPDAPKLQTLARSPMALTTPETAFFYDTSMDMETISSDDYFQSLPPEAQAFLANAKIDLKQFSSIFGNDLGFLMSWPANAMIPTALLAVDVKDRARAQSIFESAFTGLGLQTSRSERNGATVFGFPTFKVQLAEPGLAITEKFAIASLTMPELDRVLAIQPGSPTLESAEAFKPALGLYKKTATAFAYLDSKSLFERVYNLVRPIAIFAGNLSPNVATYLDVSKLPETETISRHLTPILYTNQQVADGILIESTGPITLSQAGLFIAVGVGASYGARLMGGGNF